MSGILDDLADEDRVKSHDLADLIEKADPEWMRDALHAVLGVCSHHTGTLVNQVVETIRYELDVDTEDES